MDIQPTTQATDDQELARVLDSMNQSLTSTPTIPTVDDTSDESSAPDIKQNTIEEGLPKPNFEESPLPDPAPQPVTPFVPPAFDAPAPTPPSLDDDTPTTPALSSELEGIKKDALTELRPLVDKLDLPAEEKFDTLLLIIRSTDDQSLVPAAHIAAKAIEDEGKRAAALLDIIKEIDYFSRPQQ